MVYDKNLANRIRKVIQTYRDVTEKEMFGGISFLINRKMCCGVIKENLLLRLGPRDYEILVKKPNFRPMDFTGRPLRGFIFVNQKGCETSAQLAKLVKLSADYVMSIKEMKKKKSVFTFNFTC
jgi:TfoX/Sxy family transcriptional regulator of competence genes